MKSPRSGHTATAIPSGPNAGKILFAGGMGADAGELSSTELYDPATNAFSPGPGMGAACAVCTAAVITSGNNAGKDPDRQALRYSRPQGSIWNSTIRRPANLLPARGQHA